MIPPPYFGYGQLTKKAADTFARAFIIGALVLVLIILYLNSILTPHALGSAPSGLNATVATSSMMDVGISPTPLLAFATSSCGARIISTRSQPIMIGMSENQGYLPTGVFGVLQAASTTVQYDSGITGCGAWRIYGFTGTTTVMLVETR